MKELDNSLVSSLKSAPEVFKRNMQEQIEGRSEIEVVSDDFIVVGCCNTVVEGNRDNNVPSAL